MTALDTDGAIPVRARVVPGVMADELNTLLHAAGEQPPFVLVAPSFGSYNAVMFAHQFPGEVAGLVLIDGLHTFSDFPFSLNEKLSLRTMQFLLPFGLPRWRKWCGGAGPESQSRRKTGNHLPAWLVFGVL